MRVLAAFGIAAMLLMGATQPAFAAKKHAGKATLFKKLGGKKAITAVVDDFVTRCATDKRIASFFAETAKNPKRLARFKNNLVAQICEASGGPCKYKGRDMKTAHAGMGVQETHFNALVENLQKTLKKFKVGKKEQGQLLAVLGPMKTDIVEPAAERSTASEENTEELTPAPAPGVEEEAN